MTSFETAVITLLSLILVFIILGGGFIIREIRKTKKGDKKQDGKN